MPNWLGDFVLALSVVERRAATDDQDITLIVPESLHELASRLTTLKTIVYRRKSRQEFLGTVSEIAAKSFEKICILPVSLSSAWLALRARIPVRRGVSGDYRRMFLTEVLPRGAFSRRDHLTEQYARVLQTPHVPPEYWEGAPIERSERYRGWTVLCPGAIYGPAKRWPGFDVLTKQLVGQRIVLLGDKRDSQESGMVGSRLPHRVHNLMGRTTLVEAAAIVAGANVVISNDSGLMHLAGFLGAPVVGIFGSTSPEWTRPLGSIVRIARAQVECSPCFKRTCPGNDYSCLSSIIPEAVAELAREIMLPPGHEPREVARKRDRETDNSLLGS
jgi:heptosyltransferase-2